MPITGNGWELHVNRLGMQRSGGFVRTIGTYQVYLDGQPVADLAGFMCERPGPGDNSRPGNGKRIEAGRYPLWTQYGKYRSTGYSTDTAVPGKSPMPGIRLEATGRRVGILIHPAHPPTLYLSSIGCFNPSGPLDGSQSIDFWDSRRRTLALLDSLRDYARQAFADDVMTRIGKAVMVVDGEPTNDVASAASPAAAALAAPAPTAVPPNLPISKSAALRCTRWLMDNFGNALAAAVVGKPYKMRHLAAIVCQETAYKWVPWIGVHSVQTILERAVYDASGDYPGAPRSAFPVNTAAFRQRYGDALTDMLIEEANRTRSLQNYGDKAWVYKGYGLFQYDLQHILTDQAFFANKQWYDFDICLAKCVSELDRKLVVTNGDLWEAIRAYNGAGAKARQYREHVRQFSIWCAEVTGEPV